MIDVTFLTNEDKEELEKKIDEGGAQSDWNQSDPTASDYVKNRTHWVEETLVEILPKTVLTETPPDGWAYDSDDGWFATTAVLTEDISVGDACIVTCDGVDYTCVAADCNEDGVSLGVMLGDCTMMGGTSTGEPFTLVFIYSSMAETMGGYAIVMSTTGATSMTISVKKDAETIHPLPGKFLPEGTPWVEGGGEVVLYEGPLCEGAPVDMLMEVGKEYKAVFDGTAEFIAVAKSTQFNGYNLTYIGNMAFMGGEDNGLPYIAVTCVMDGANVLIIMGFKDMGTQEMYTTAKLASGSVIPHPIDKRCLPDGLGYIDGIKDTTLCDVDLSIGGSNMTAVAELLELGAYAELLVEGEVVLTGTVKAVVDGETALTYIGNIGLRDSSLPNTGETYCFETFTFQGMNGGIYRASTGATYPHIKVWQRKEVIVQADEKCLPQSVQDLLAMLPVPTADDAGKVLKVKADGSGYELVAEVTS